MTVEKAAGPYGEAAKVYFAAGWANPIPVREKRYPVPGYTGYGGSSVSWADIAAWTDGPEAGHNIALRMAGTIAIDIDAHDGEIGNVTITRAQAQLGELPATWASTSRGQGASRILIYKLPIGCTDLAGELGNAEKHMVREFGPNVEILHRGHRYAIVWPSVHPETRAQYRWYLPNGELSIDPPKLRDLAELPAAWWEFLTAPAPDEISSLGVGAAGDAYVETAEGAGGSSLFGSPARITANTKTAQQAAELLVRERDAFVALTDAGNGRTQKLNNLALLAGHGVPDFWSREAAQETLMAAARESGYVGTHGERAALVQVQRGLTDGSREPWAKVEVTYTQSLPPEPVTGDDVDRLLAEMLHPAQVIERPAPRPLIKGLLNMDSESWIIGEPGSKKSFVALDMAGHVARGLAWQGRRVEQGCVVMIVAEGAGGMGPRLAAWQKQYGAMGDEVFILPRPVQARDTRAWATLREACRRVGPVLVVIDTQARVTVGLEENSATEMGVYIEAVRAIREATGACVLSVHHTGRRGGDARGSSAIDGAQHTELKVDVKAGALRGELLSEKQKDMELAPAVPLVFGVAEVGRTEEDEPITSLVLVADAYKKAAGEGSPEARMYVPTFDEKDVWRRRILDALFQHAPRGTGATRPDVTGSLAEAFGMSKTKLTDNGAYKTAWRELLAAVDPYQELIIKQHGTSRFEIGSLAVLAGLEAELGQGENRT